MKKKREGVKKGKQRGGERERGGKRVKERVG